MNNETLPVTLSADDMRLLRALAATAGATPAEVAARFLSARINVEAGQLMRGD